MLVALQIGIFGVIGGHHFIDVRRPFVGVVIIERQERLETLVSFPPNQDVGMTRLRIDGDECRLELRSAVAG